MIEKSFLMGNKYASFFAAYHASVKKGNPFSKEETVSNFTNGRTVSLGDLDYFELQELTRRLTAMTSPATKATADQPKKDKADSMRKAIIAIFRSMERTVEDAKQWAEKQGVKGVKKGFNEYTTGELYVLISIAEKVKTDWMTGIRNRLKEMDK